VNKALLFLREIGNASGTQGGSGPFSEVKRLTSFIGELILQFLLENELLPVEERLITQY